MSNITLDTTGFSEQLGVYDFFNILISGTTFALGMSIISSDFCKFLWNQFTIPKSFGIIIFIYTTGLILQEVASILDAKCLCLYKGMNRSILKERVNANCKVFDHKAIIENPLLLKRYRKVAKKILEDVGSSKRDADIFEEDNVNGLIFSVCQYYLSACAKDKKIEKMRALFNMSIMLMACFGLLAFINLVAWHLHIEMQITLWNFWGRFEPCNKQLFDRMILSAILGAITIIFYYRAQKIMRRFLLIMMGTYDAIIRAQSNEIEENENRKLKVHVRTINRATVHNTKMGK